MLFSFGFSMHENHSWRYDFDTLQALLLCLEVALRECVVKAKLKNGYSRCVCEVVLFDIIKRPYIKLTQLLLGNRRWFSSALVTYVSSRRSPTCHSVMPKMREHESLNRGLHSHLVFPINCMENLKTPLQ